jgi:hypothetical protein
VPASSAGAARRGGRTPSGWGGLPVRVAALGPRRHEQREDRRVVAREVEVLQVEPVVPGLMQRLGGEPLLAALEFDREDRGSGDDDGVDPAAETGNVELEVEPAGQPTERCAEEIDLHLPSGALHRLERVVRIGGHQRAEDLPRRRREKVRDRGSKVGRAGAHRRRIPPQRLLCAEASRARRVNFRVVAGPASGAARARCRGLRPRSGGMRPSDCSPSARPGRPPAG